MPPCPRLQLKNLKVNSHEFIFKFFFVNEPVWFSASESGLLFKFLNDTCSCSYRIESTIEPLEGFDRSDKLQRKDKKAELYRQCQRRRGPDPKYLTCMGPSVCWTPPITPIRNHTYDELFSSAYWIAWLVNKSIAVPLSSVC